MPMIEYSFIGIVLRFPLQIGLFLSIHSIFVGQIVPTTNENCLSIVKIERDSLKFFFGALPTAYRLLCFSEGQNYFNRKKEDQ